MKSLVKKILCVLACVQIFAIPTKADTMLAVMSPHQTQKNTVKDINLLRSWLLEQPKGDSIVVLNGWNGESIATLTRPVKAAYQAPKTIILQNREGLAQLVQFAKSRTTPTRTTGTLHLPRLMTVISQHYPQVKDITLIGSASFDLPDVSEEIAKGQTYPADSNLAQSYRKGLYGISDVPMRLKDKRFHWLLPNSITPYHFAQGVERFYHLYLHKQQGSLITFSVDKNIVKSRLFNKAAPLPMPYKLSRNSSSQPLSSLFTRTPTVNAVVSAYQPQHVRIGIAWQGSNADLDIYGMLRDEEKPVYYGNTSSRYATHHKDIMSGSNKQTTIYELITYQLPISVCDLRIGINHYSGNASKKIKGTLRVEVGDALIAKLFSFSARQGNQGQDINIVLQRGTPTAHSQRFLLRDVVDIKGCA